MSFYYVLQYNYLLAAYLFHKELLVVICNKYLQDKSILL